MYYTKKTLWEITTSNKLCWVLSWFCGICCIYIPLGQLNNLWGNDINMHKNQGMWKLFIYISWTTLEFSPRRLCFVMTYTTWRCNIIKGDIHFGILHSGKTSYRLLSSPVHVIPKSNIKINHLLRHFISSKHVHIISKSTKLWSTL